MCCFNTNNNTTFEVTHTHTHGRGEEEEAFFLLLFSLSFVVSFLERDLTKTVLWYHLFPNNFRVRDELETLCDAASRKDDDDDARVALRCRQREGNDHHKRRRA